MVFKLTPVQVLEECGFENDVKEYGFQACKALIAGIVKFENDVKGYGFQADIDCPTSHWTFENDVKEYSFQT